MLRLFTKRAHLAPYPFIHKPLEPRRFLMAMGNVHNLSKVEQTQEAVSEAKPKGPIPGGDHLENRIDMAPAADHLVHPETDFKTMEGNIIKAIRELSSRTDTNITNSRRGLISQMVKAYRELDSVIVKHNQGLKSEMAKTQLALKSKMELNDERLKSEMKRNHEGLESKMKWNHEGLESKMKWNHEGLESKMKRNHEGLESKMERNHKELESQIERNDSKLDNIHLIVFFMLGLSAWTFLLVLAK